MLPNPILQFGEIKIHMYGVMIAVGILAAFIVLYTYGKKLNIHTKFIDFIYYNAIVSIILGFGSAAVFQAFYNYIENPEAGFKLGGGITFIGGLIGGAAAFLLIYFIFRKKLKGRLYEAISLLPCCIFVGHAFGRIGCFFAGCCYGRPTDSFLGVKFPEIAGKVHPTQLYEAAFLLIMFGICSYLLLKKSFKHNMSVYLIGYGVFRFLIEFVRNDDRGQLVAGISPSQFWSILMIGLGIGLIFLMNYLGTRYVPVAAETEETADEISVGTEESGAEETEEVSDEQ